ncbi:ABC transporter ATP-binding protein [Streptomyces sp. HB132]|uniref:ABC transporter ATP-binding protein n=1 Tax=Streptomyces sp. HB132 TaxID=767388 RepID=UPI0019619565|nr:ABC transporter ATP-binding protein [Streptomyces sp. HB132]MBM7439547.1 iron complex transport system ATP-binding protein [Streptomyces sp. HB132]
MNRDEPGTGTPGDGLRAARVSREAGGRIVLDGVSVAPPPGTTVGLLGPNGSGKTTLLRVMAGVLAPGAGVVTLDGRTLAETGRRGVARRVAVVDQHAVTQVDLSVLDVVRLGRIPHRRAWSASGPEDEDAVREALARTGLADRAAQSWHTLSGGERQRVQIARALAQQPRELLLDEPTNHLDIQHQLDLLSLVAALPVTAVIALHDLNLAAMFCDRVTVMKDGRVVAGGTPSEVITEDLIAEVYRVRAVVTPEGPQGRPSVRFMPGGAAHGRWRNDERAGP